MTLVFPTVDDTVVTVPQIAGMLRGIQIQLLRQIADGHVRSTMPTDRSMVRASAASGRAREVTESVRRLFRYGLVERVHGGLVWACTPAGDRVLAMQAGGAQ